MLTSIRRLFCCLIFFLVSCRNNNSYKTFIPTKEDSVLRLAIIKRAFVELETLKNSVQTGDVITRTGNDYTSESLRSLNQRDKTYSHCGIASVEQDSVFVYHALGGDFNPDQKIKREPFEIFTEPYTNKGIGIFRFNVDASTKQHVVLTARDFFNKGIMFDMDFNLKTDDRMYCAEYVYKCFSKASDSKLIFNHSHINQFEFIGVDDIFLHPLCQLKSQLVYK